MTDFTWDISFQLTGTYENNLLQQTFNVPATVTGTIVTDIDSGFLNAGERLHFLVFHLLGTFGRFFRIGVWRSICHSFRRKCVQCVRRHAIVRL